MRRIVVLDGDVEGLNFFLIQKIYKLILIISGEKDQNCRIEGNFYYGRYYFQYRRVIYYIFKSENVYLIINIICWCYLIVFFFFKKEKKYVWF